VECGVGGDKTPPLRGSQGNPPYPPLSGGQEKAKPLYPAGEHPGGGISPFYTPLTRGGRGGFSDEGDGGS